jgi:hypothetical protein
MNSHTEDNLLENILINLDIKPGQIYYHSDPNKHYEVLLIAIDESTESPMIIYRALYGKKIIWSRLESIWSQQVRNKDNEFVSRFKILI